MSAHLSHHTPAVRDGKAALAIARKSIKFCLLCGTTNLHYIGAFAPRIPELWFDHLRPDARRTRWFGLCKPCARKNIAAGGHLVDSALISLSAALDRGTRH